MLKKNLIWFSDILLTFALSVFSAWLEIKQRIFKKIFSCSETSDTGIHHYKIIFMH